MRKRRDKIEAPIRNFDVRERKFTVEKGIRMKEEIPSHG
jgi:hypothetical protein